MIKRYLIYLRVSTEKQEDSGLGLDAQRHACLQWVKSRSPGAEVIEFIDVTSGTDLSRKELEHRPNLVRAVEMLRPGDVLLVYKRERMVRDTYLMGMLERMIEKKKARLESAIGEMEGFRSHDVLARLIKDAFAHYEPILIAERIKDALARKKARGERLGHIPYGWRLTRPKGPLEIEPEEAETLRIMWSMRNDRGMTFRRIASELNNMGRFNRHRDGKSSLWTYGATARVYKNYVQIETMDLEMEAVRTG